ncbi:hypothetical protein BKA69DRAFT_1171807 [Paraphysoderma sedebokerense]|nr:hypothetical protein BKA69DRAFT_1171807 [Paraphysoderma sedebokerense]
MLPIHSYSHFNLRIFGSRSRTCKPSISKYISIPTPTTSLYTQIRSKEINSIHLKPSQILSSLRIRRNSIHYRTRFHTLQRIAGTVGVPQNGLVQMVLGKLIDQEGRYMGGSGIECRRQYNTASMVQIKAWKNRSGSSVAVGSENTGKVRVKIKGNDDIAIVEEDMGGLNEIQVGENLRSVNINQDGSGSRYINRLLALSNPTADGGQVYSSKKLSTRSRILAATKDAPISNTLRLTLHNYTLRLESLLKFSYPPSKSLVNRNLSKAYQCFLKIQSKTNPTHFIHPATLRQLIIRYKAKPYSCHRDKKLFNLCRALLSYPNLIDKDFNYLLTASRELYRHPNQIELVQDIIRGMEEMSAALNTKTLNLALLSLSRAEKFESSLIYNLLKMANESGIELDVRSFLILTKTFLKFGFRNDAIECYEGLECRYLRHGFGMTNDQSAADTIPGPKDINDETKRKILISLVSLHNQLRSPHHFFRFLDDFVFPFHRTIPPEYLHVDPEFYALTINYLASQKSPLTASKFLLNLKQYKADANLFRPSTEPMYLPFLHSMVGTQIDIGQVAKTIDLLFEPPHIHSSADPSIPSQLIPLDSLSRPSLNLYSSLLRSHFTSLVHTLPAHRLHRLIDLVVFCPQISQKLDITTLTILSRKLCQSGFYNEVFRAADFVIGCRGDKERRNGNANMGIEPDTKYLNHLLGVYVYTPANTLANHTEQISWLSSVSASSENHQHISTELQPASSSLSASICPDQTFRAQTFSSAFSSRPLDFLDLFRHLNIRPDTTTFNYLLFYALWHRKENMSLQVWDLFEDWQVKWDGKSLWLLWRCLFVTGKWESIVKNWSNLYSEAESSFVTVRSKKGEATKGWKNVASGTKDNEGVGVVGFGCQSGKLGPQSTSSVFDNSSTLDYPNQVQSDSSSTLFWSSPLLPIPLSRQTLYILLYSLIRCRSLVSSSEPFDVEIPNSEQDETCSLLDFLNSLDTNTQHELLRGKSVKHIEEVVRKGKIGLLNWLIE